MDYRNFSTLAEAEKMKSLFGPLGLGATISIPSYGIGMETPKYDDTHLMYLLYFGNGFVASAGLLLNTISERGGEGAAWDAVKAEMGSMLTAWWATRPL